MLSEIVLYLHYVLILNLNYNLSNLGVVYVRKMESICGEVTYYKGLVHDIMDEKSCYPFVAAGNSGNFIRTGDLVIYKSQISVQAIKKKERTSPSQHLYSIQTSSRLDSANPH